MDIDSLRKHCLSFPHTTENVQWEHALCFKVDGKLFAVARLEVPPLRLSFKCSPENFVDLCECEGVRPAPYMARAQWVAVEHLNTLPDSELRELLAEAYRLVWERLPKKRQAELKEPAGKASSTRANKASKTTPSRQKLPAKKSRSTKAGKSK